MKRFQTHLTDRQLSALKAEAKRTGLTVAELVRRAVDEFLIRTKKGGGR